MGKIIGFISEKGGVGKTTACFEIAVALRDRHAKNILIVDADYQLGGITFRLDERMIADFTKGSAPGTTLYHKYQQLYSATPFTPNIDVYKTSKFNIDFIPADPRLATVSQDKLPSPSTMKQSVSIKWAHLKVIADVLHPLKTSYDYVFIDSHPEISDVLRSVIYASDYVVSPVKLDLQSAIGVATVVRAVKAVNEDVAAVQTILGTSTGFTDTKFAGAIGMMAREWGGDLKDSEQTEYRRLSKIGDMFEHYVTEGDGIRRAAQGRTTVRKVALANARKQAEQFDAVAQELLSKCP